MTGDQREELRSTINLYASAYAQDPSDVNRLGLIQAMREAGSALDREDVIELSRLRREEVEAILDE